MLLNFCHFVMCWQDRYIYDRGAKGPEFKAVNLTLGFSTWIIAELWLHVENVNLPAAFFILLSGTELSASWLLDGLTREWLLCLLFGVFFIASSAAHLLWGTWLLRFQTLVSLWLQLAPDILTAVCWICFSLLVMSEKQVPIALLFVSMSYEVKTKKIIVLQFRSLELEGETWNSYQFHSIKRKRKKKKWPAYHWSI